MTTQAELERKIAEITKKLNIVCQSYSKLKLQLREKDQEIISLRGQVKRLAESQQLNNKVEGIRKKYDAAEVTFKGADHAFSKPVLVEQEKQLKNVKSLGPSQFSRPVELQQPKPYESRINSLKQYEIEERQRPIRPKVPLINNRPQLNMNFPSAVELQKGPKKTFNFADIDRRYQKQSRNATGADQQALVLKQLWEQRDKQIRRMDELFQNLNKRIASP